ncbi:MAG TPA: ankyrin repeat domain-containing protein [Terriglobales bacterium]|nr:ankyrin repeat domain-containing protein [Terriglobales bacterium]
MADIKSVGGFVPMDLGQVEPADGQVAPNDRAGSDTPRSEVPQNSRQSAPPPPLSDPMETMFAQMRLNQGTQAFIQNQNLPSAYVTGNNPINLPPSPAAQADIDALGQAAAAGDLQKVKDLLNAGVDINGKDSQDGQTALMRAVASGNKEVTRLLLQNFAYVNATDMQGRTALTFAAGIGHPEFIKALRAKGADPNIADKDGQTPLMEAAANGDAKSIDALITGKGGADVNAADRFGNTALHLAAGAGHPQAVKALLDKNGDFMAKDSHQRTPLMEAARQGNPECIKLLLNKLGEFPTLRGDVLNAQDEEGRTALIDAAARGKKDAVKLLAGSRDIDVNAKDNTGRTALLEAAAKGSPEMLKALLAKGADPNLVEDTKQRSPLMEAAANGPAEAVEILAKTKKPPIDLNLQDKDGQTALLEAVARGDVRAVKALLQAGARKDLTDSDGGTALSIAQSLKQQSSSMQNEADEILKLLQPTN